MKRIAAVLLTLVLLWATAPAMQAADNKGAYKVTAEAAGVYAEQSITATKLGEVYAGTVLDVTSVSRGFGQVKVKSTGITGWVQLSQMEYLGGEVTGEVTGISVTPPDKTVYLQDAETLDLTGMKVYAVYDSGIRITVTGFEVFCDAMDTLGEKEVRVTYTPKGTAKTFTGSFKVTVERYPVTRLTLITAPTRSLYLEHEKLDLSGLVMKLTFADGRPEQMLTEEDIAADPNFTVSGCCGEAPGKPLKKGDHTVTVTYRYEDISASFPISVTPRALVSLTITRQPDSLVTHHRDRDPDINGLLLKAEYDNGEVEEIESYDCQVVCDPSTFILGAENPVDVAYGGKTVRLYYKLSLNDVTGIRAVPPKKLSFIIGEEIDLTGLKVRLVYADGTFENITDYEMTAIDPEREGSQNIIVRYGEYSDVFTINITTVFRRGDVNGDGRVTPEDARLTLRASVGYIRFATSAFKAADIDGDNEITPGDARMILRASVGLEKL